MAAAFHKSIVRIVVGVGKSRGTGFVARVEPGAIEILTALHVVADLDASRASGAPAWLDVDAEVKLSSGHTFRCPLGSPGARRDVEKDWALLRFEGSVPDGVVPLRLARLEARAHVRRWSTFGYSDAQPDSGEPHSGDIEDERDGVIYLYGKQAAAGSGGFLSGCSGAPCIVEGHVVGIIVEALQKRGQSVHGSVYAQGIESVAASCGLPLAPGPQVFEEDVVQALAAVGGPSLLKLAKVLDVPTMAPESSLRLWVARALLRADELKLRQALADCVGSVTRPEQIAEMALAKLIRPEGAQIVRRCFDEGDPKGVATIATGEVLVRLLVARAFEGFGRVRNHFKFVDSRARSREAWSARVRDALLGLLRLSPDEVEDDAALDRHLAEWGGALLAFPFDPHVSPLSDIERYKRARALAMVSKEQAETFAREGYALALALDGTTSEQKLNDALSLANRYFRMKTQE